MTETTVPPSTTPSEREPGPQRWFVGVLSVVLAAAFASWGTFGSVNPRSFGSYLFVVALSIIAAVVAFGVAVPRAEQSGKQGRYAVALSCLAVLSSFFFWTGLPFVLGLAGMYLGAEKRDSLGFAAVAVGALAVFGSVALYVLT